MTNSTESRASLGNYRAVVCSQYGSFEDLQLQTLPRQPLAPTQVRIAVAYAGVSFAHSLVVAGLYQRKPPLPFTPGTEAAGTVIEVGAEVGHLQVGDRVCAVLDWGGYAEEAVVDSVGVFPLAPELPLAPAITLPISYGTSYGALIWRARLQAGQTALIFGAAGGVGLAAAEIARAVGAKVIAVVNGESKAHAMHERGFEQVIDAKSSNLREAVNALTSDHGVDVVFDPIGGDTTDQALRLLADDGRLLTIGYASGTIPQIPTNILLLKNISVMGFNWGQYVGWGKVDERLVYGDKVRAAIEQLMAWWQSGDIQPSIYKTLPLGEFVQAMQIIKSRDAIGRVALDTSQ
ncbi:NADPH:quinone oxidoreductase family protein [Orrella daihaiensis]|uniref:NADPH:quinone oxidoreductase family protein n=1 Tax=Orrella daihaiensis TaxID=2782176 RepID=A0ABY4AM98_9BURK|nr:NADPH:quinone oxidoreductase family protein [Orrella daihaiensis]UOD51402.1 NADPH:quinone oxidoreductase family protein [Orrella daihaiensis]